METHRQFQHQGQVQEVVLRRHHLPFRLHHQLQNRAFLRAQVQDHPLLQQLQNLRLPVLRVNHQVEVHVQEINHLIDIPI